MLCFDLLTFMFAADMGIKGAFPREFPLTVLALKPGHDEVLLA